METNRQKKIAGLLQEDLGDILGRAVQSGGLTNLIISVTKVSAYSPAKKARKSSRLYSPTRLR